MAKDWIKKAIKHKGRYTQDFSDYDLEGSPQWNLAQQFKKGNLIEEFKMGGKISDNNCLECGGRIKANKGVNVPEKQIPTSEQVKAWNKAKYELKLQLEKEGKDISYLDHNLDYAKSFLQTYNKQNNFIFGKEKSPEEIVKYWQEYNNDVYSDPTYKNSLLPFNNAYQKSVENNVRNDSINENNRSDPDGVLGSFTINDTTPFRILQKKGTDESGEAVIILNPYSPQKFTIEKNSIIKKNTPVSSEQLLQELYNVPNYGVTSSHIPNSNNSPAPSFQNGGIVKAWIQKFMKGGYIAEDGYPNAQELTQPTTNYYNWGNYNNSFVDPASLNQNPFNVNKQQMQVPMAQSNMPQNIGTSYFTPYNATNDEVNKGNALANSMMGGNTSSGLSSTMVDPILGTIGAAGDVAIQGGAAIANMVGDKKSAAALQKAGNIGKIGEQFGNLIPIPGAGKAVGAVVSALAAPFTAWGEKIAEIQTNKENAKKDYVATNTPGISQPSYYGQTNKYGSTIKNIEKRIIDDIHSDFDKYMKLT